MKVERWIRRWFLLSIVAECLLGVPFSARSQDHADVPPPAPSPAPSEIRRFELGLNFSSIRTDCIGTNPTCGLPSFALGVGASFHFNPHFALEANTAVTPTTSRVATNFYGGRHSEYLMGARAEARAQHYGYFLKAQPGVLSWNHAITQAVTPPSGQFYFLFGNRRNFVTNLAAGFEYTPSPRVHIRAEIGDLLFAFSRTVWLNNLQSSAGVYYGIGKPLSWKAPVYDPKRTHHFFDWGNKTLLAADVLAITADSITTQRFIARGVVEGDPFARPLVKYGWSGQLAASVLEINAVVWGMYGLHRIHQHWIERIAPMGVAAAHGFFAYGNDRINLPSKTTP